MQVKEIYIGTGKFNDYGICKKQKKQDNTFKVVLPLQLTLERTTA